MWSEVVQLRLFGPLPNDVPDDVLGDAFSLGRSMSADGPEDPAVADLGRHGPTIDRLLDPRWHGVEADGRNCIVVRNASASKSGLTQ